MDQWPLRAEILVTEDAAGEPTRDRACALCHKAIDWEADDRWPCDLCGGSFHDQCCGGGLDYCHLCGAAVCELCGGTEEFIGSSPRLTKELDEKELCVLCRRAVYAWVRAENLRHALRAYP